MDIKTHVTKMASALKGQQTAGMKTIDVLKSFINEAALGEELIKNYLEQVQEQAIAKGVTKASSATYKSNIKKILTLAKDHKQDVLKLADSAGNLDQWYKACLEAKDPSRNKTHKVNKPKTEAKPTESELAEPEAPETVTSPLTMFADTVKVLLDAGMTIEQMHKMIDDLAGIKKAA